MKNDNPTIYNALPGDTGDVDLRHFNGSQSVDISNRRYSIVIDRILHMREAGFSVLQIHVIRQEIPNLPTNTTLTVAMQELRNANIDPISTITRAPSLLRLTRKGSSIDDIATVGNNPLYDRLSVLMTALTNRFKSAIEADPRIICNSSVTIAYDPQTSLVSPWYLDAKYTKALGIYLDSDCSSVN